VLPYQRPPLSKKYLMGDMPVERLLLRPETYYAEADISVRTGQDVAQIDRAANVIHIGDEPLAYDALALTTGSAPRHLPAAIGGDLNGVFVMRDLADADAMAPYMQSGKRLLIVGGHAD